MTGRPAYVKFQLNNDCILQSFLVYPPRGLSACGYRHHFLQITIHQQSLVFFKVCRRESASSEYFTLTVSGKSFLFGAFHSHILIRHDY